jgi:adenosine deaminase
MNLTHELLLALPKTDLHVHLDGSLRLSTLIELAREQGVELPSWSEAGLRETVFKDSYANLEEYLQGFAYTTAVLGDEEALERVAYEFAWDNIRENVCYVEVRFAPQLHMGRGLSYDDVFGAVARGMGRAQSEHASTPEVVQNGAPPFRFGIIACAMRMFSAGFSPWFQGLMASLSESDPQSIFATASLELARAAVRVRDDLGIPVVGFDLAGAEAGFPAVAHSDAFQYAHDHFLKKTVHAGEAYGPESIFQAITALHADRIGHGYHLFSHELIAEEKIKEPKAYTRALAEYIADRRITIEVCITSNLQTNPSIGAVQNHKFGRFLEEEISATLCTDNRLVSHTSVTQEIQLAVDAFAMTPQQLRNIVIYGFKRSFFPGSYREKRAYVRGVIDHYDRVVKEVAASAC